MSQNRPPLEELTLRQLRQIASEFAVSRYSRMRKDQLIAAIRAAEGNATPSVNHAPVPGGKEAVEGTKFSVGNATPPVALAEVDVGLGELPGGYGQSRIVLLPRDPQWAYTYWDVPNEHKDELRRQGGQQLALRLYDVTDLAFESQGYHSLQEYPCDELSREWYLPLPVSDRTYIVEIGYRCADGRWLMLARSASVTVPPTYPSDWFDEVFITVPFDSDRHGKTFAKLAEPYKGQAWGMAGPVGAAAAAGTAQAVGGTRITDEIFRLAGGLDSTHVAGSLFGSRQMMPTESPGAFAYPSGAGLTGAAVPAPWMASGSGLGLFSGASEAMPQRSRQFWLVADAELIVYGATEPDATVTIGGRPVKLNPDGTFRLHMAFPDGNIDYPIFAVAADAEQNREIHMTFDRATLKRRTNTKTEAVPEAH